MSQTASPDRILDCRHLSCPLPVVRTAQAIKELDAGQVLDGGAYHVLLRRTGAARITSSSARPTSRAPARR